MPRHLIAYCILLIGAFSVAAQERQLAPLPVEDAIAARTFSTTPFSLSNDGQWLAYTLNDPRRSQIISDERHRWLTPSGTPPIHIGSDIWITNTRTRATRSLTEGKGNSWAPAWSPDGNYLAFFSDRGGVANLWLWERSSGKLRQVSDLTVIGYKGLSVPRWSHDGKRILFCVLPEGMTIEKAALLSIGLEQNPPQPNLAKPDQPTVTVFKSAAKKQGEATAVRPRSYGSIYNDGFTADLVITDLAGSPAKRLLRASKPCSYWFSPDGRNIAFTTVKNNGGNLRFDLLTLSLRDESPVTVATNLFQGFVGFSVSWSPDGTTLSYTNLESQPGGQLRRECYLTSADGKQRRKVTGAPGAGFSNPLRAPLWDKTGEAVYLTTATSLWRVSTTNASAVEVARLSQRNLVDIVPSTTAGRAWSPDSGRSLVVTTSDPDSLRAGFARIDVTTGEVTALLEEDKAYGAGNVLLPSAVGTTDGQTLIYVAEDAGHSPDFWAALGSFRDPQRITATNPQLDKYLMGTSSLIEWKSLSGERLRGALLLPAGYQKGKRYPMVVLLYPDEELSRQVNLFGLKFNLAQDSVNNQQLLATRGYAVLLADSQMKVGDPMQEIVRSVMPGVNKAIEMGIADPDRLGIMGHSHGGYAVLSVVTQVSRFKAAVCWAGIGNLVTMYGQMDTDGTAHWINWAETEAGKIGGSLWEVRERFIENSPIFYLDKVTTPLLIVQGSSDHITPARGSDEIFIALRRLGKEVEYARYEGEDHGFWFYPNQVDYCNRVIRWFDQWLKPAGADVSSTGH
jgi:dipeptidyl aminopeptidase/acylaminoacyl peptidase